MTTPMDAILVKRSSVEAAKAGADTKSLAYDVFDFVHAMIWDGYYESNQINPKAVALYHVEKYYGEVMNGGHSQFIHNTAAAGHSWNDALEALQAMGASKHEDILRRMISWVEENPEEAEKQTGFTGGIAPYLDQLDEEFYEVNRESPLTDMTSQWALGWDELRAVDDDAFERELIKLTKLNPNRSREMASRRIDWLNRQIAEWLYASTGMAAAAVPGDGGRRYLYSPLDAEADGLDILICKIDTLDKTRWAVVSDSWTRIYEFLEEDSQGKSQDGLEDDIHSAIRQKAAAWYGRGHAGAQLSEVEAARTEDIINLAISHNAAVALDLLLRNADYESETQVFVSAVRKSRIWPAPASVEWAIIIKDELLTARTSAIGASLTRENSDGTTLMLTVDARQIAKHHIWSVGDH
ncbi:DMP19 family protein [Hoeflea sp. WL0058]|uniref:DMP19 family protein n=1 Tax=Flavimaribacter sediminis TaxID=2865987 RepID=A0AAE3D345_9HYPH|nr:DUF4375 domain-containing protein [Flavimaribacter sediminis]MBW8639263.1 DMP19 family protein [Flavimaribacter sediminis]